MDTSSATTPAHDPAAPPGTRADGAPGEQFGLGLAVLVWNVRRASVLYRIAFFLPFVLPQVAGGVVWGWIYEPSRGWHNRFLEAVGLGSLTKGWLGDPDTALYAVLGAPTARSTSSLEGVVGA